MEEHISTFFSALKSNIRKNTPLWYIHVSSRLPGESTVMESHIPTLRAWVLLLLYVRMYICKLS